MLQTLFNILLIILGFGVLIFIHELGHFVAAKWAGIRVEAFAVGMGTVALSWRKGIGARFGSSAAEVDDRIRAYFKSSGINIDLTGGDENERRNHINRAMDALNIGETEYSLRWLPVGGFVKMLGQEDANPNAVSDDPRSYNMRPIGKRMVVVSAGVIMNLILAIVLFVIAFVVGVRFPAAVVGDVSTRLAAGTTMPENAAALGITDVGLQPGDRVLSIDGDPATTFADLQIASAMCRPGSSLRFEVERPGVKQPLIFNLKPEKDPTTGLLSIGIGPGASNRLVDADSDEGENLNLLLERIGLAKTGVKGGMTLLSVNDRAVTAYGQLADAADASAGQPLHTTWAAIDKQGEKGAIVNATMNVRPDFEVYQQLKSDGDAGLVGFSPLTRFVRPSEGSQNAAIIKPGDVLIRIADVPYPRRSQLFEALKQHRREDVPVVVLRNGEQVPLTVHVDKNSLLRAEIEFADDLLITAQPVNEFSQYLNDATGKSEVVKTPAGRAGLFSTGGTHIVAVAGKPVATWEDLRNAIFDVTAGASAEALPSKIELSVRHPIPGAPEETVVIEISKDEIKRLHDLKWHVDLPSGAFEPLYTIRQGSPVRAVSMGFEETRKMVMMTYLTLDRLVRGSVGVDQLRGPVGIVHIGAKVAREGFMYLLFFLGMISVNLAVINFLPLPIVDGGLFLFLIYEKFKGRPPSLAFQNAATIVGLVIIGSLFLITFYNDVLRLFT